jgi:NAD(P)-dependent dehydrogenase (short-subunit alcohol dehydrogenase family)
MPPWSLISPASRGIGFALARRVLQTTNAPVVVTARKDLVQAKKELLEGIDVDHQRLTLMEIDVLGISPPILKYCAVTISQAVHC